MKKKHFIFRFLIVAMIVAGIVLPSMSPAYAYGPAAPSPSGSPSTVNPDPGELPGGTSPGVGVKPCEASNGVCRIIESVTNIFKVLFPFKTMRDALVGAINDIGTKALNELGSKFRNVLYTALSWVYNESIADKYKQIGWKSTMSVAAFLMPLTLIFVVVSAMRDGVTSVTGYASARQAVLDWLISVGFAAASYYFISLLTKLSAAASYQIAVELGSKQHFDIFGYFIGNIVGIAAINSLGVFAQLFVGLFAVGMVFAVLASLVIALLAREVVLLLLTIIAPIIIVLGAIEEVRWLVGLWSKAFLVCLLLGPINVLLLSLGGAIYANSVSTLGHGNIVGSLIGTFISIGVTSILIGLNTSVGNMVFAAAQQIAEGAAKTAAGIVLTVAGGAVLAGAGALPGMGALGGAAGKAAVSGGGAAASAAGAAGSGAGIPPGGGLGGPGGAGGSLGGTGAGSVGGSSGIGRPNPVASAASQLAQNKAHLQSTVGGLLKASNLPVARGVGMGLQASGGVGGFNAKNQEPNAILSDAAQASAAANIAQGRAQEVNTPNSDLSRATSEGRAIAESRVGDQWAAKGKDQATINENLPKGMSFADNTLKAADMTGVGAANYVSARTGVNLGSSSPNFSGEYSQAVASTYNQLANDHFAISDGRFADPASSLPRVYDKNSPLVTPADMDVARSIVLGNAAQLSQDPDAIASIAFTTSQLRYVGGESYENIYGSVTNRTDGKYPSMSNQEILGWTQRQAARFPTISDASQASSFTDFAKVTRDKFFPS